MLKGVYSFKNLDLDIAQAYIAIVLDYHSQYKAAERVLNFYKYVSSDENEVTVIREKKYLEYLALAKKQKKSFLATVIHDMYNNKVLDNGRNRNNSLANKVSLLDLNVNISEKEIYNDVMILQTSQEHILIHYMRTHTFFVQFRKWLKNKYPKDKFNRPNNFTDAKCKELLNPVITRCRNYFTNNFNKSSIGLDDYIFKALNMYFKDSPDKDGNYDKKSEVNEFFEIMNRHGQDREVSGSDADSSTTALNFVGIDLHLRKSEIDFRDIAIKICKASKILYTHKGGAAFYDIFSRYRDLKFRSDENAINAVKKLRGCFVYDYGLEDAFDMQKSDANDSFRNKCNSRERYLYIFDKILISGGVSMKDIKTIYDNQIEVSLSVKKRDQKCIYKVEGGNVKGNFKNSERFKTIYDGFIALKDLINFINSSDNVLGVTLYNLNTEVFRNQELANTITDLESYVKYGSITSKLVSEVSSDYDGVMMKSNTEVKDELNKLKVIDMFEILKDTPLNSIQKIREIEKKEKQEKNSLVLKINAFKNKVNSFNPEISFIPKNFACPSDYVCDYINRGGTNVDRAEMEHCIVAMCILFSNVKDFDLNEQFQFVVISKYLAAIECIMALDGVPMLNKQGLFDYKDTDYILNYMDEEGTEECYVSKHGTKSIYVFDYSYRKVFIDKIFDTLIPGLAQELPYWQKLRILFSINNFLICFLKSMRGISNILDRYADNPVSVYISLCDYLDVLNLDLDKISVPRLYRLYNYTRLIYQTGNSIDVYKAKEVKKEFELCIQKFFITLFSDEENKTYYNLLQKMKTEMFDTFKPKGCLQNVDPAKRDSLRKIARKLDSKDISYVKQAHEKFFCDKDLLYRFRSCAEFNEDGFAVQNGELFESSTGKFLHHTGASVKPDILGIEEIISPITDKDVSEYALFSCSGR